MRIGVLGTGMVGRTLAARLGELGHDVRVGSRSAGEGTVTFADAAAHGEVVVNATAGTASLQALNAAGEDNLAGKVLVDVANPIASYGPPITLDPVGEDSLAEQIQRRFPAARVVKALNTVTAPVMVDPGSVPGAHDVFLAGDDDEAKDVVRALLVQIGWPDAGIHDVGGVSAARGLEMYLVLWLSLASTLGRYDFNIHVVAPPGRSDPGQ